MYMYDVFISYSRRDTKVANRICKAFDDAGITYFIDRQGIGGAYEFPQVLAEAIISSKIFLYLASSNSYASKFTQSEITFAFNRKDKGSILPYIIDGSSMPISLELVFSAINWRNLEEHPIETVLVDDLLRLLGKERKVYQDKNPHEFLDDRNVIAPDVSMNESPKSSRAKNRKLLLVGVGAILLLVPLCIFLKGSLKNNASSPTPDVMSEINIALSSTEKPGIEDTSNTKGALEDYEISDLMITANGVSFVMKYVPSGYFLMGSESGSAYNDEKPVHKVSLDKGYYIGETEVTQMLWEAVMGNNPSEAKGALHPVEHVSYKDCINFIDSLNKLTGYEFRLPTEAEWEFAAHGGSSEDKFQYSGGDALDNIAWYAMNSEGHSHDIKGKLPNRLGLYDMTGNVWEWCNDRYGAYISSDSLNPHGPVSGKYRVYRGGDCHSDARYSRLTTRGYDESAYRGINVGLRLALDRKI